MDQTAAEGKKYAFYSAYGLTIQSEIALPELRACAKGPTHSAYDHLEISHGKVPETLSSAQTYGRYMDYTESACLFRIPKIARFLVEAGRKITIEAAPEADPRDLRAFLLGGVLGAALHQRKLIPLHVSAVETPSGLVAFTGPSGAGKSTLTAALHNKFGWPALCDDVAVLSIKEEAPYLTGGVLRLKLWKDSLQTLNLCPDWISQDPTRFEKYHLQVSDMFVKNNRRLTSLIELKEAPTISLEAVSGANAFTILMNSIYRPYFIPIYNEPAIVTKTFFRIVPKIACYELRRPLDSKSLQASLELIADRFG